MSVIHHIHLCNSLSLTECTKKIVDLVFLFDGSGSMTTDEFDKNKGFINNIMTTLKNSSIKVNFPLNVITWIMLVRLLNIHLFIYTLRRSFCVATPAEPFQFKQVPWGTPLKRVFEEPLCKVSNRNLFVMGGVTFWTFLIIYCRGGRLSDCRSGLLEVSLSDAYFWPPVSVNVYTLQKNKLEYLYIFILI